MNLSLFLVFSVLAVLLQAKLSLVYVNEMSSSGARTRTSNEIDPYNTDYGVLEQGDLTPTGMRQHYLIGRLLRKRYNSETGTIGKLYNETYNAYQMQTRSSNYARTLNSAFSQQQGLFPPGKRANLTQAQALNARPPFNFNPDTWDAMGNLVLPKNEQVLPALAYNRSVDYLLDQWCPGFTQSQKDMKNSDQYKQAEQKYSELRKKVAALLGKDTVDLETVSNLRNGLVARQYQGLSISDYDALMSEMAEADFTYYSIILTGNQKLHKVINSEFFNLTLYKLGAIPYYGMIGQLYSQNLNKIQFYSYHSNQLLEIGTALGIDFKKQRPPYASVLIHELYHDSTHNPTTCSSLEECYTQYYVKVKYNDDIVKLKCTHFSTDGQACRLDDYLTFLEGEIPSLVQILKDCYT